MITTNNIVATNAGNFYLQVVGDTADPSTRIVLLEQSPFVLTVLFIRRLSPKVQILLVGQVPAGI